MLICFVYKFQNGAEIGNTERPQALKALWLHLPHKFSCSVSRNQCVHYVEVVCTGDMLYGKKPEIYYLAACFSVTST
jgi:hypothetical protein